MYSSAGRSVPDVVQTGYAVKVGQYISEGWAILQKNLGGFVGFTALWLLFNLALNALPDRLKPLGSIATTVVSGPLSAGMVIVAFKIMKEQATTFSDFFRGFNNFLPLFLASLVSGLFTVIGFIALVLPGIYLAVAYAFTVAFIVDRKFDFWDAMESSRKVITRQWFGMFWLLIVLGLIILLGLMAFGVGVVLAAPLASCAIAAAYRDIMGLSSHSMIEDQP